MKNSRDTGGIKKVRKPDHKTKDPDYKAVCENLWGRIARLHKLADNFTGNMDKRDIPEPHILGRKLKAIAFGQPYIRRSLQERNFCCHD